MADVQHSAITDPHIHEPKGIDQALPNSVYVCNGADSGSWQILPSVDPTLIGAPVGSVVGWTAAAAPTGWMLCTGTALSRVTYSVLFSLVGTMYGAGDGSTTFNIPDLRGRVVAGKDDMGSVSANRLTYFNGDVTGTTGGTETVTVLAGDLPVFSGTTDSQGNHSHVVTNGTLVYRSGSGNRSLTGAGVVDTFTVSVSGTAGDHSHTITANAGGGAAHPNVQPTIVLNYIIKTGV